MREIHAADWKRLRPWKDVALQRFCQRVLDEVQRLLAEPAGGSSHQRYLALFKLIEKRDDELADTFNDLRRSTALRQLAAMRGQKLITDEEFAGFSPETREVVEMFLG
jgi:hypothetical protein